MYYTLLFLTGLFFSGIWGFSQQAQAAQTAQTVTHCALTLNQRLELQIAEFSWQALLNRPLPLWQGFLPQAVPLRLTDSNCVWLLTHTAPPENSVSLPDFNRVFALSPPEVIGQAEETQLDVAMPDLPGFCRPLASAFRGWGHAVGLVSLDALDALNGLSSAQTGPWQRELKALERALQAGDKALRREWIQLFLAGRSQRLGVSGTLALNLSGQTEGDLERLLGLESWICLRQEEALNQTVLPEELTHLDLFRNQVVLFNQLFDRSEQGLTELERLRHAGLLQALILEQLYPDWQKRIVSQPFVALLSDWSAYQPAQGKRLAGVLAQRFPEKQIKTADANSFGKQKGYLIAIELNVEDVDLRPQQLVGLSAEQFLLLQGSQVHIRHPRLWGELQGLTRVSYLPAGRLRLEFVLPLRAYLHLSPALPEAGSGQGPTTNTDPPCQDLRLETPVLSLWGRCLRGESDLQGYFLRLPV